MQKWMKSKRGSHVGMIMSFVIFIVFIVFLYTTLQPVLKTQRDKQVILDQIKQQVVKEITGNLTTATVKIVKNREADSSANCVRISDLPDINGKKVLVKNIYGTVVGSSLSGNFLDIKWGGNVDEFFQIYYSTETFYNPNSVFSPSSCVDDKTYYEIDSVRQSQIPFFTLMGKAGNDYVNNYGAVKQRWGIPADSDFKIQFPSKPVPENLPKANIYADTLNIQYISPIDAEITSGAVKIYVW